MFTCFELSDDTDNFVLRSRFGSQLNLLSVDTNIGAHFQQCTRVYCQWITKNIKFWSDRAAYSFSLSVNSDTSRVEHETLVVAEATSLANIQRFNYSLVLRDKSVRVSWLCHFNNTFWWNTLLFKCSWISTQSPWSSLLQIRVRIFASCTSTMYDLMRIWEMIGQFAI